MKYGGEYINEDDFNPDGTVKRGPVVRPKVTYQELEMTEEQRRLTPATPDRGERGYNLGFWDRIAAWSVKPGDEMLASSFKEMLELRQNFQAGLAKSGYDYIVTANNIAEYVTDKLDLPYEAKKNVLAAAANKLKNMNIQPTSTEWEDQLFYLVAMLVPDAVMILTGGGVAGAGIKYGLKAATMSNRTATIASIFGRLAGDTAVGSLQMMAHEAGQAELEGREANFAQAGKDGAIMSIALSSIGRSAAAIGLKRRYSAVLTGTAMNGISKAYGDPNDPAYEDTNLANTILGFSFGLMTPGTHRVGAGDILKWVKVRKSKKLDVTPKAFLEEFAPHTYEKVFVDEVARDRFEFEPRVGPPRKLSPRDLFMDQLADITNKDIHGLKDDQVVHVVMEYLNDMQLAEFKGPNGTRMSGIDSISNIKDAKIMLESISAAEALHKVEYPNYESRWAQPDTPIRYKDRVNLKVPKLKKGAKSTDIVAIEGRSNKKIETNDTIIHKRSSVQNLKIHELSWNEYKGLLGDTPENRIRHKEAIETAALGHNPKNKKTWPNKGALIEYGMQNDWGYLWRKPGQGAGNPRLLDRPEPAGAAEAAQKMRVEWEDSIKLLSEAYYTVEGKYKDGVLKQLHKLLVDPAGDLFKLLETAPDGVLIPVRNALQLRYGKSTKIQMKIDEMAKLIDWENMSKDQRRDFDIALWNRAKLDDALRHGTDPAKAVESPLKLRQESRRDGLDLIEMQQEERPGGIKVFEDKIRIIEDFYKEALDLMVENDLISRKAYLQLKKFRHIPYRTIDAAFREMQFHQKGFSTTKVGPSIRESPLKNILAKQTEELQIMDSELLVNRHIAIVENLIADNAIHTEMAKTQGESGGLWYTKGNEPPKHMGPFERKYEPHSYLVDGEPTPIYVDEMLSKMISSIDQERIIKGWAANALRFMSGTQFVQLSAVALNPIFGIVTHPLDVGMIFSGHARFGGEGLNFVKGSVPHLFSQFYVKGGGDAGRGWFPFAKNIKSAWSKDAVFKDWVEHGGVEQTLVSHFQHVEGIKRATDIHNSHALSRRAGKGFFEALELIGKFGHVMEVATRITERDMLVAAGMTKRGAANESLRRLNYGMQGKAMQFFGTLIPFANAQAQILAHVGRSWTRSKAGARQAALVTSQLVGITMATRMMMEEYFPKYMEDIPWETRRRYFIIPTGATTVVNGVTENVYFKIKKAYSPVYTVLEGWADMVMDRMHGYKQMPASVFQRTYEAAEVAMPLDLRSIMPPVVKVWMAAHGTTIDGRKIYKGGPTNLADEYNREGQKGVQTEQSAILLGQITGLSPARMQEMYDSVIADNPISWWVSSLMPTPEPEVQRSMLAMAVKSSPIRKIIGTSNNKWRNSELARADAKEAGSIMIKNVDDKVNGPVLRLWNQESSIREFAKEMALLQREANTMDQPKFQLILNQTIDSYRYVQRLLKSPHIRGMTDHEYKNELFGELDPLDFWPKLRQIDHAPTRAKHYVDRYNDTDDDWKGQFRQLAMLYGFFRNGYFVREVQILERLRRKQQ